MINKTLAITAIALAQIVAADEYCRALVMSGGANNGAWEAGVLWGLVHYGNPADFTWNVVTGVSAGAINTGAVVVFAPGDEVTMSEFLSYSWTTITTQSVWLPRPGGYPGLAYAMFEDASLLNDAPLVPTIAAIIEPFRSTGILRPFTVATVDANSGEYVTFTEKNTTFDELPQSCASSGSIPVVFQPQHFKGMVLMDGGTVWDVNIDSAINYCLD